MLARVAPPTICLLTLLTLATLLLVESPALAYCRSTTIEPGDGCDCSDEGFEVYWDHDPIPYALNERGFPGLSDETVRSVIARSFAHWTDVSCASEPALLSVEQLANTTPMTKEHRLRAPNLNVIAHLSAHDFLAADGDRHAFALTSTYLNTNSGEILGADIIFNQGLGPFAICPDEECPDDAVDLENVATHEIGHFFGLGHSDVADSTMECSASPEEVKKRSLERDDTDGICAIYGPIAVDERADALHPHTSRGGCACQLAGAQAAPSSPRLLLTALALFCAVSLARARSGRSGHR